MSIKSDRWIRRMATQHAMIEPFAENQARAGVISYGVSSYGYDMRVAPEFKIFTNALSAVVDPKCFDPKSFVEFTGDVCIVPPNSFALARSVEYFRIPRNVLTICVGKSTYARCGIITNVTPFEPEWEGFVTLEISNTTPLPARIYANEGIAQVLFFTADEATSVTSATRTRRGSIRRSAASRCRGYRGVRTAGRDPSTVMTTTAPARMTKSGTQPSSVRGTVICRKFITKSNTPTSRPSSTVAWSPRPKRARMLPPKRATAPWPAAIPRVVAKSSINVLQKPGRPA